MKHQLTRDSGIDSDNIQPKNRLTSSRSESQKKIILTKMANEKSQNNFTEDIIRANNTVTLDLRGICLHLIIFFINTNNILRY